MLSSFKYYLILVKLAEYFGLMGKKKLVVNYMQSKSPDISEKKLFLNKSIKLRLVKSWLESHSLFHCISICNDNQLLPLLQF